MRAHLALPILCWICASFSVPVHGTRSGSFTCARSPPAASSVQELVHRSGVVVEGKLQEEGRESDINQLEREALLRARGAANRTASEIADFEEQVGRAAEESLPNGTSGSELYHVRVRVHQVWQVKSGGLEKDSVVSLIWNVRERCAPLRRGTRYVFFMEPTNDTSVFHSVFPPVETRRSVRRNATQVLCQGCVEPKLKNMKSVEVLEGKKAVLKCEPRAGQTITRLKWYKDGKEFAGKNKPKNVKIKVKNSPELRFRKAKVSDSGLYTCEAINDLGKDSTSANLTVIKAATSTTAPVRTSSHEKQCPEKEKNYCVNGGTCFTIEVAPGNDRLLCRCLPGYNGNRCQDIVPMKVMNGKQAEELYQKRVLTITGICIALLVVGIMCVVAYCKTKKQRKKLHDRLRQSLRNERNAMAAMANGPQISSPPSESLQLVSQYVSKNAILAEHTIEKETETSFSTTPCTSSTQSSTAATQTSTKSWSKGRSEIIISHSHSVLVTSSESSKHVTPSSRRGRLDATGCVRELSAQLKNARDTPDSYKDSPYSERYVSAMTTPNRMSPVELLSPESPKSPPSEMSPPLSSLAMSVPSIPVSPQGEEERPLLFTTPPRLRDKQRQDQNTTISDQYQRNSAHYNHAHEAHSPPPSPQRIVEDDDYETTQEYEAAAPQPSKKLANGGSKAKRTKVNGHTAHKLESNSESSSESSSSESETEDERVGEDTPFLSIQNPLAANLESAAAAVAVSAAPTSACRPAESSRTNPALRLSTKEDLQARLSSVIANQDPIAV